MAAAILGYMSLPQEVKPETPQARLLAFILAGVFYGLGVLFFIGDALSPEGDSFLR